MSEVTGGGKEHYEVLDGLRGTAALLVVLLHVQGVIFGIPLSFRALPRSYLAVDFFFLLSGFVIGFAYDNRWSDLTFGRFLGLRIIRLHPLVVLGMLLGFLSYLVSGPQASGSTSITCEALLALAFNLFLLPNPSFAWHPQSTHALNGPAWSLMQEYIGNFAYALVLHKLSARALALIAAACGVVLLSCAIMQNTLNLGFNWHSFWMAPVRLGFPFITGLWLYRVQDNWPKVQVNFFLLSLALIIAFAVPILPADGGLAVNGALDAGFVLLLFPSIIIAGAHSSGHPRTIQLCKMFGQLSYPLYITHGPLLLILSHFLYGHGASIVERIGATFAIVLIAAAFARLVYNLWDIPVRRFLSVQWLAS